MNEIEEKLLVDIRSWIEEHDQEYLDDKKLMTLHKRVIDILKEEVLPIKVDVNGTIIGINGFELTYEQVVKLVPGSNKYPGAFYTITYYRGRNNLEGTLYPGSKPIAIKTGTVINAFVTGNA